MKLTSLTSLIILLLSVIGLPMTVTSCIEDDITLSPAHQPEFSTDTLRMGALFTGEAAPTFRFKVYNRHDKVLNISSIRLRSDRSVFRLNVDGLAGSQFSDIEIRPNDSIFVMVATTLPVNGHFQPTEVSDIIDFVTNGVTRSVVVTADGSDVERVRGEVITADTRWTADRPRQIFDSLVVAPGVTLTIDPGVTLYFHDGAYMNVRGSLVTRGEPGNPVQMCGDRTGDVISGITFDLMSRQWTGLFFAPTARSCSMAYTEVRNTWTGVTVDSTGVTDSPVLTLQACRLRNSAGNALNVSHSRVEAFGCEFAEAGEGAVSLRGGAYRFVGCTFSNYYLFSAIMGPLLRLTHLSADDAGTSPAPLLSAEIINCIFYGSGTDITPGDLAGTGVTVRHSLLRSAGTDDDNFIECLWDTDPLFYTVRADYIFDYRIHPDSPAIGYALPGYSDLMGPADFYGTTRTGTTLGAYEPRTDSDPQP